MRVRSLCILTLLATPACLTPRQVAIQQAAFDHKCAEEKIAALRESADGRTVELDVCGQTRRYQDVSRKGLTWIETTNGMDPSKAELRSK